MLVCLWEIEKNTFTGETNVIYYSLEHPLRKKILLHFVFFKFSWEYFKCVLGLLTGLRVSRMYDMQRPTQNLSLTKSVPCFSVQW